MGERNTPFLLDLAQLLLPAIVGAEVINDDLSAADVKNLAIILGAEVVTVYLVKKLKDAIKNTSFDEVNTLLTSNLPTLKNKVNIQTTFRDAFTTTLARKVFQSGTTFGDKTSELVSYLLSTAQRGLGPHWFTSGISTWKNSDYTSNFKIKSESPTNSNEDTGNDWMVLQVLSDQNDPSDVTYVNTSFYSIPIFNFSPSAVSSTLLDINTIASHILKSDIPDSTFFSFADSLQMITGSRNNNSSATPTQVTSALDITTNTSGAGLLADINATGVAKSTVSVMSDIRVIDALKKAPPDTAYDYVNDGTATLRKTVPDGYLVYSSEAANLIQYLKIKGQNSQSLIELLDSPSGFRTDTNSEDVYTAITSTDNNARKALFYNSNGSADNSKDVTFRNVLDAVVSYESNQPQEASTISSVQQFINYLKSDNLSNPVRTLIDNNNTVGLTTSNNNEGFNAGNTGKLRTFLAQNKIMSIRSIIEGLKQIAAEAINFRGSSLTPEEVIRNTLSIIETNFNTTDFPSFIQITSGPEFYEIPSSIYEPATPNLNKLLVSFFAIQNGYKLMDIVDNYELFSLFVKVASSETRNTNGTVIINVPQLYSLGVSNATGCPQVTLVNANGGLENLGDIDNTYNAYLSNKNTLGAGEDVDLRTYISTKIPDAVVNTPGKLDTLAHVFGLNKISSLKGITFSKNNIPQFASPTNDDNNAPIQLSNTFSNGISSITLKGYTNSEVAGHADELAVFKLICVLVDIYKSISVLANRARKVSEVLNANESAKSSFFVQTPLIDSDHLTLFRGLLANSISNNDESILKQWITSKNVRAMDALAALDTSIYVAGLTSKNLVSAVDEASSTDKLTLGSSGVISRLARVVINIFNKDAYINPESKVAELKTTFNDLARLSNMISGTHAIIIGGLAGAADDNGSFDTRLTEQKYNELKLSGFSDSDLQNCVVAKPKAIGFEFSGVAFTYLIGRNSDGSLLFER